MRAFLLLLATSFPLLAQVSFVPSLMGTWEPRNIATKAGLVASYDPGNTATETFNPAGYLAGSGVSQVLDRAMSIRTGNLLLQSEDFSTTWARTRIAAFGATDDGGTGSGSFVNTARTTDPLGGNTADFVQEDNTAGNTHYIQQSFPSTVASGDQVTAYVFAKADTTSHGTNIMLYASVAAVGKGFDLIAGTAVPVASTTAPTSSSITSLGSGWYLCSIKFTAGASEQLRIHCITNSAGTYDKSYNGDNTKGVFLWGGVGIKSDWTPVTGATLATGYQVTTTAAYAPPDLTQGTAANQPKISRTDNAGNLCVQSETFATTWLRYKLNAFGVDDSGNAGAGSFANTTRTTDPLGGNTADFIQEDATATDAHAIFQSGVVLSAGTYTLSFFARTNDTTRTWTRASFTGPTTAGGYFDLVNGVTGTASGSTLKITAFANNWYLCQVTAAVASGSFTIYLYIAEADNDSTFSGDNTHGFFFWGASVTRSDWTPVTGTSAALGYVATTTAPIFPGLAGRSVLYFDGSAYRMQTAAITLNQPTELYKLANPWTWTLNDVGCDGYTNQTLRITQSATTPKIRMDAGTAAAEFTPPPLGVWRVISAVFDGASSRMSTNSGAFTVSDAGTGNAGGFTLGSAATAGTTYWNGLVARTLICNKTNQTAEANYLRWGLLKQASLY